MKGKQNRIGDQMSKQQLPEVDTSLHGILVNSVEVERTFWKIRVQYVLYFERQSVLGKKVFR
jgi:hypothetical protein